MRCIFPGNAFLCWHQDAAHFPSLYAPYLKLLPANVCFEPLTLIFCFIPVFSLLGVLFYEAVI